MNVLLFEFLPSTLRLVVAAAHGLNDIPQG